jgi:hypothetical protein
VACRYVFGVTHVPRLEDWPVMPVEHVGFNLLVRGATENCFVQIWRWNFFLSFTMVCEDLSFCVVSWFSDGLIWGVGVRASRMDFSTARRALMFHQVRQPLRRWASRKHRPKEWGQQILYNRR